MIPFAGTMQNYVKTLELQWQVELKKQTLSQEQSQVSAMAARFKEQLGDSKQDGIATKMLMEKKLTPSELEYLRKNNPDMYDKAIKIKREREAYEKEIKCCRTKEAVRNAHLRKMQSFTSEVKAAEARKDQEAAYELTMRVNAVYDEYSTFTNSKAYKRLPEDEDELRKRQKKKGQKNQESVIVDINEDILKKKDWRFQLEPQNTVNKQSAQSTNQSEVTAEKAEVLVETTAHPVSGKAAYINIKIE